MPETVLIIEDEKNIQELLKFTLAEAGYKVIQASNGRSGAEDAKRHKPNLILLDLMLPELNGIEVCKILKQNDTTAHIPIIILTAKSSEVDKVIGLEIGADDYVTKPFSPRELQARVKAVLRRGTNQPPRNFSIGTLAVDVDKHQISVKKKSVDFTSKEFELLKLLIESRGKVLSRELLLEKIWGYDSANLIETRTIDMHILQIRKKIGENAKRLLTIKGIGYRFDCD